MSTDFFLKRRITIISSTVYVIITMLFINIIEYQEVRRLFSILSLESTHELRPCISMYVNVFNYYKSAEKKNSVIYFPDAVESQAFHIR